MSYSFNSIVGKNEADALKDMIFQRVRERAAKMDEDIKDSYTSSVKNDVMELAHNSFVSKKNPFALATGGTEIAKPAESVETETSVNSPIEPAQPSVGFKANGTEKIYRETSEHVNRINAELVNREIEAGMDIARKELQQKQSFVGALNFLNSHAAITLIKKEKNRFEAFA